MLNNKSYFSIFADDFKLMKTELKAEEILDMMSALSDMCMWGETDYEPKSSKQTYFWEKLKSKFDCDTDIYKKKSEAGKKGMYNRWHNKTDNTSDNKNDNKQDNRIYNKLDNHLTPNTLTPNTITPNKNIPPVSKDTSPHREEQLHFGTLKNVILTEKQYSELKEKYENLDDGIEELDTWLGKNSKSAKEARGKNHYAYFKSNSWVWERVGEVRKPVESVGTNTVLVEEGKFFIDDTMPEYRENCQKLTDEELEKAWKWIMEHFEGKTVSVDFVNSILKKFDTSDQFRQAQGF